jgi:hypothetical protein
MAPKAELKLNVVFLRFWIHIPLNKVGQQYSHRDETVSSVQCKVLKLRQRMHLRIFVRRRPIEARLIPGASGMCPVYSSEYPTIRDAS